MKRKRDSEFAPDDYDPASFWSDTSEPPAKRRKITPKNLSPVSVCDAVIQNAGKVSGPHVKRPSKLRGKLQNLDDKETRIRKEEMVAAIEELNAVKDKIEFREYLDTYFGSSAISEKLDAAGIRAAPVLMKASGGCLVDHGVTMTMDELSALKVYIGKRLQLKRLGIAYIPQS